MEKTVNAQPVTKKLEHALLEKVYQNNSPIFYLTTGLKIKRINTVAQHVFGREASKDILGRLISDAILSHQNSITDSLKELLSIDCKKPSKKYVWELIEIYDDQRKLINFILVGNDVTTYSSNAEQYRQISFFLKKLIKIMPGYVVWKDSQSICLGCNDNFASAFSLKGASEVIGKTYHSLLASQSEVKMCEEYEAYVIKTGKSIFNKVITLNFPDKGEVRLSSTTIPIFESNGKIPGVLIVMYEVPEQNALEDTISETNRTQQVISDFLASMSHDLRTPLNGIMMASQFLEEDIKTDDQKELVTAIKKSAERLLFLVEDILNFTQAESGKLALQAESFDLRKTTEEIVGMIAQQAREKKIDLILSYSEFIPRHVIGNYFYTHRIILNLLENAIKFTSSGYVLIKFDGHSADDDKVIISIRVEDTGIGIEKAQLQHIFERFTRLEPTYKGHYKGTGLGLSTVKRLVEKMEGIISVTSEPKKGSVFTVTLPFKKQDIILRHSIWSRHYSNLSILVIDDLFPRGRMMLRQIVSSNSQLIDSSQAIKMLDQTGESETYDVIIIDDQIEKVEPIELAKRLKSRDTFKETLLIYATNVSKPSSIMAARRAGFFTEIHKPIKPSELISVLENAWGKWLLVHKGRQCLLDSLKPTVLLIERDTLSQKVMKLILNELGYMVDIYKQYDANILCKKQTYDLILLDNSSIDNAIDVVKYIREFEDKSNPVPIIFIANRLSEEFKQSLLKFGVSKYLNKPVDHEQLDLALFQALLSFYNSFIIECKGVENN